MSGNQMYKIGAVSRLTGIPAVTIRMWERRHEVVTPQRTETGRRLYSQEELNRLALLKQAVDAGHSISTIAALDADTIQRRLAQADKPAAPAVDGPIACFVVGGAGFATTSVDAEAAQLVELGRFETLEDLVLATQDDDRTVDALLVELDLVTPEALRQLKQAQRQTRCSGTVVVYQFGARAHLDMLRQTRARVVQAPAGFDEILILARELLQCLPKMTPPATDDLDRMIFTQIPQRRFSASDLSYLASASSAVKCECPEHLALLIERLAAFEDYSEHCENENSEDAGVHMMLHGVAAHARRALEDALQRVVEFERIELPVSD